MSTSAQTADALDAIRRLTPAEIEDRIAELRSEDAALRMILRSVRARERVCQQVARRAPRGEVAR